MQRQDHTNPLVIVTIMLLLMTFVAYLGQKSSSHKEGEKTTAAEVAK